MGDGSGVSVVKGTCYSCRGLGSGSLSALYAPILMGPYILSTHNLKNIENGVGKKSICKVLE